MNDFKKVGDDPEVLNFLRDIASLPKRNLPEDSQECPDCDGYGYILTEDSVQICHCLRDRKEKRRTEKSNIPKRYLSKTLDNFKGDIDDRRMALRRVRTFVSEFKPNAEKGGLFLFGAAGTGKTHLAVGALKELLARGRTGLFYNMVSLLEDFRKEYRSDLKPEEEDRLKRLLEVDVLVLDDLGAGKLSEFVLERTYSLIDKRYSNNQAVIVTSNLGMNDLEKQISYPVFSRIRGMCTTIPTGETDFRNPELKPGGVRKKM
jgi:DNA replication protein DnaC